MAEWVQLQGSAAGVHRTRSYSMSYADSLEAYQQHQHLLHQQKMATLAQQQQQTAHVAQPTYLPEGSPSSSSSCGSDDAPYPSGDSFYVQTQHHLRQTPSSMPPAVAHNLPQRRASLSAAPMAFAGGFVGEGLRAEYVLRRPSNARRQSISLGEHNSRSDLLGSSSSPDSEASSEQPAQTGSMELESDPTAMRRNSLPTSGLGERRTSCPLTHTYTPLTAVPTLGRALAEGNLGQRKSIQSFLSMLAQSSVERSDKRRRKRSRSDRKRRRRSDYESSDEEDDSGDEGGSVAPVPSQPFVSQDPISSSFSSFDFSSGSIGKEASSDTSSDTIPTTIGEQVNPGAYDPAIAPMSSGELHSYSSGNAPMSDSSPPTSYPGYSAFSGISRPRSFSSPPVYSQANPLPQNDRRHQYVEQTNKRLDELRKQHIERLQREKEEVERQRHSYEFYPQSYPAQPGFVAQSHVLDLETHHGMPGYQNGVHMTSASLPSVMPSHEAGYITRPSVEQVHQPTMPQELMEQQVRSAVGASEFDFYNEFSDFNMCEPAHIESLCQRTADDAHLKDGIALSETIPAPEQLIAPGSVSDILGEFATPSVDCLGTDRKDQSNDDVFNYFNLDDPGLGSSH